MTNENNIDISKSTNITENIDQINNEIISLNQQELSNEPSKINDVTIEQIAIEKPKRPGRKKRDTTLISDVKTENTNSEHNSDTQPLFEQPIILEGKRSRKPTSRLELSDLSTPKRELSIPQGHGKPLGEIAYIDYQIAHAPADVVSVLGNICFAQRASSVDLRKSLRGFKGFEFEFESNEYQRHLSNLKNLRKNQITSIADVLGLSKDDQTDKQCIQILNFLMKPIDEGKEVPSRMRISKTSKRNISKSYRVDDDDIIQNGDDFDDDEYMEDEENPESDEDYIGSDDDDDDDDESGLYSRDDPDDFIYQPGKKTPKKRSSIKRTRSRTNTPKRKRGITVVTRRGQKRSKIIIDDSNNGSQANDVINTNEVKTMVETDITVPKTDATNEKPTKLCETPVELVNNAVSNMIQTSNET